VGDGNKCEQPPGRCPYTEDAANKAVKKCFAIMGVDIDKPESVAEFQEDLRFGKKIRKAADYGLMVFVAVVLTAVLSLVWAGAATKVNGG